MSVNDHLYRKPADPWPDAHLRAARKSKLRRAWELCGRVGFGAVRFLVAWSLIVVVVTFVLTITFGVHK
jgi:hypothetical protein